MTDPPPSHRPRSESPNWSLHCSQKPAGSSTSARSLPKHRHPLHERTLSHQNELNPASPTIRLIRDAEDEDATVDPDDRDVYGKSPFPSHPSQVFTPRTRSHGFTVAEDQGRLVSAGNRTEQPARSSVSGTLDAGRRGGNHSPPPAHPSPPVLHPSTSTRRSSDADTLLDSSLTSLSPSSKSRFSQGSSFASVSPNLRTNDRASFGSAPRKTSDGSEPRRHSGTRAVPPATAASPRPPPETVSEESLVSSTSSETFRDRQRTSRAASAPLTPSPAPRPTDREETQDAQPSSPASESEGSWKPASSFTSADDTVIRITPSLESLAFAVIERDFGDQTPSPAGPANPHAVQAAIRSGARIQYPVVRPPSASGSFAESSSPPSSRQQNQSLLQPSRMNDPFERRRWSAQLSTIPSESERVSQAMTTNSGNSRALRRATIGSIASSVRDPPRSPSAASSISYPAPLFSPSRSPVSPIGSRRESDEHEDTLSDLHPPGLRTQRSYLGRVPSDSRPGSAASETSSYANFVTNNIPAWAKFYYRRGERVSMAAPSLRSQSSDGQMNAARSERSASPVDAYFPHSVFRPRNRPRQGQPTLQVPRHEERPLPPTPTEQPEQPGQPEMPETPRRPAPTHVPSQTGTTRASHTDSLRISEAPSVDNAFVPGTPPRTRRHISMAGMMSPHLGRDRRSAARLSAWTVPSLEGNVVFGEGGMKHAFSAQGNRQVILFVLGFLLPFSWMIAAFLPLPSRTDSPKHVTPSQLDVEVQANQIMAPMEERRYLKARWWRNLNRIMSAVGLVIIVLVVVLVTVGELMGM